MTPLEIEAAMQAVLDDHLDGQARLLAEQWARAWVDISAELEAAILGQVSSLATDGEFPHDPARVKATLDVIERNLAALAEETASIIGDSAEQVVRLGTDGQVAMYQAQKPGAGFNRVSDEQLNAIIQRSTGQITAASLPIAPDTHDAIKRRLNRGVALGDNPRTVADQIMQDCEGHMNMGLSRALNISRTEMVDAMRSAQYVTDQVNTAVLSHWVWVAHLDSKTCGSCIAQHGTEWPIYEEGPLDHHSGRCGRMPVTKSWADLGVKGVPDTPPVLEDAGEWFGALSPEEQKGILGRSRFDAWQAGDYPMSAWSRRVENPDWRAAYVMTKAPKGNP